MRPSGSALSIYRRHPRVFLATGAVFIPIGLASALFNDHLELDIGDLAISFALIGGLPLVAAFVFVNSAVAALLAEIDAGRRPRVLDGYRMVWTRFRTLLWAPVKALAIVTLLAVTVAGLPWAIQRLVRWLFVEQAIVLDGADSRSALAVSAAAVRGRWWRTAALAALLSVVGGLLGPVVAIAVLLLFRPPAELANILSSVIYALVLPLVFIALTQFYSVVSGRWSAVSDRPTTDP